MVRRQLFGLLPSLVGRHAAAGKQVGQIGALAGMRPTLARGFADDADLKKTVLYDFHIENGGQQSRPNPGVKRPQTGSLTDPLSMLGCCAAGRRRALHRYRAALAGMRTPCTQHGLPPPLPYDLLPRKGR